MSGEFALIEDGYSVETTIPRVAGLHPAVKVRFRPALAEERHQWLMDSDRDLGGKDRVRRTASLIARHLEAWDVKTRRQVEVNPKDEASIIRLQPTLLTKISDLILGYAPVKEDEDEKNSLPACTS